MLRRESLQQEDGDVGDDQRGGDGRHGPSGTMGGLRDRGGTAAGRRPLRTDIGAGARSSKPTPPASGNRGGRSMALRVSSGARQRGTPRPRGDPDAIARDRVPALRTRTAGRRRRRSPGNARVASRPLRSSWQVPRQPPRPAPDARTHAASGCEGRGRALPKRTSCRRSTTGRHAAKPPRRGRRQRPRQRRARASAGSRSIASPPCATCRSSAARAPVRRSKHPPGALARVRARIRGKACPDGSARWLHIRHCIMRSLRSRFNAGARDGQECVAWSVVGS